MSAPRPHADSDPSSHHANPGAANPAHAYPADRSDSADHDAHPGRPRRRVIDFSEFQAVDMRVGRVTAVDEFPEARKPAWKLTIDFGPEIGIKRSSAQVTHYSRDELVDTLVVAVVNFPPRQIGPFFSEVLVLGALDDEKGVVLLRPDRGAEPGSHIG